MMNAPRVNVEYGALLTFDGEWYKPVFRSLDLAIEGGVSHVSYDNLLKLMKAIGKPDTVKVLENRVGVMVSWEKENYHYLATGFSIGYLGSGPHYLARFGHAARFGKVAELYEQVARLDQEFVGILWNRG